MVGSLQQNGTCQYHFSSVPITYSTDFQEYPQIHLNLGRRQKDFHTWKRKLHFSFSLGQKKPEQVISQRQQHNFFDSLHTKIHNKTTKKTFTCMNIKHGFIHASINWNTSTCLSRKVLYAFLFCTQLLIATFICWFFYLERTARSIKQGMPEPRFCLHMMESLENFWVQKHDLTKFWSSKDEQFANQFTNTNQKHTN